MSLVLNFKRASARLAKSFKIALDVHSGRTGSREWYELDEPDARAAEQAYYEAYARERLAAARRSR